MDHLPRHRCLIYSGPQTKQLAGLAATILAHLKKNYRCFYLNSPAMVEGMRSILWSAGLNVTEAVFKRSLVLCEDQEHLRDGKFDPEYMLERIKLATEAAVADGYAGLWASGDMAWEFGPDKDFSKLLQYERGLERLFQSHPTLRGVCQYDADFLPEGVAEVAAISHPAQFVNETLSRLNARYRAE